MEEVGTATCIFKLHLNGSIPSRGRMPLVPSFQWSEFMVWISECEIVKFLNLCRYLGMPRVHMQDMYAIPYIIYCKTVEFLGLNGMFGEHPMLQGTLSWGTWPWSCPSTNPQLRCFPGAALCWVAAPRAGFASPVPIVTGCGSALEAQGCAWGHGVSTAHLDQLPLLPVPCCYSSLAQLPVCLEALPKVLPFNLCPSSVGSSCTADSCQGA